MGVGNFITARMILFNYILLLHNGTYSYMYCCFSNCKNTLFLSLSEFFLFSSQWFCFLSMFLNLFFCAVRCLVLFLSFAVSDAAHGPIGTARQLSLVGSFLRNRRFLASAYEESPLDFLHGVINIKPLRGFFTTNADNHSLIICIFPLF